MCGLCVELVGKNTIQVISTTKKNHLSCDMHMLLPRERLFVWGGNGLNGCFYRSNSSHRTDTCLFWPAPPVGVVTTNQFYYTILVQWQKKKKRRTLRTVSDFNEWFGGILRKFPKNLFRTSLIFFHYLLFIFLKNFIRIITRQVTQILAYLFSATSRSCSSL